MYIPASFSVPDEASAFSFIERYDFATLVTPSAAGNTLVTHLPLLLKRSDHPLLVGHVARANEHWRHFDGSTQSIAIFHGPHGYVSPSWYKNKPAVPTWNYAVVHAYGCPRATEDRRVTSAVLQDLLQKYEGWRPRPWRIEEVPPDFYEQMVSHLVAFEMSIDRIESKFKLGQNRPDEDREGTMRGLMAEGSPDAAALAAFMREQG